MILYVLRHGQAAALGDAVRRDADRPLTDRGGADAALMGAALARLDPAVSTVFCSPLLRARQTAEAVAAQFREPPPVRGTESLSPGFRPAVLVAELQAIPPDRSVVVVGHQPDLGTFIAHVIGGESSASVDLPPAALVCLKFSGDSTTDASLRWLLIPDAVRGLFASR